MEQEILLRQALDRHADRLSALPNVQGVGISSKEHADTEQVDKATTQQLGLVVYVNKKVPIEDLPEKSRIPDSVEVEDETGSIRNVPVHVRETGNLRFEGLE